MQKLESTPTRKKMFARIHAQMREVGLAHEWEQRNIYVAVTGTRSLRECTEDGLQKLTAFLQDEINALSAQRMTDEAIAMQIRDEIAMMTPDPKPDPKPEPEPEPKPEIDPRDDDAVYDEWLS